MTLETVSEARAHGGVQGVYRHRSAATGTDMTFSVFVPAHATGAALPVVWYLSGLTCTHANVTDKGEYRRACAELGLVFVAPDTSPRGEGVPDDPAWDFAQGAGFYVDTTQAPWAANFRMWSYVTDELPTLVGDVAAATYVARGCVDPAATLAGADEADLEDLRLEPLGAFSVSFGAELVTARLGGARGDVFERARLAETLPGVADGFTEAYADPVADPGGGRIGFQLGDAPEAARLAQERLLPFAVCAD